MGRLTHVKGYDLLIRAWAHVHARHPDWTLRIFGRGPREEKLQASIDKRDLTGRVVLEGPAADVGTQLAAASMFVLSSRREGMPMVLLEAMSKGLPVVSYDCPTGPADVITDGHDGLLVKPEKIHAMADAICLLIEDEELRHKLGAHALETAAGYDIDVIGARWETLISGLVEDAARRTGRPPARVGVTGGEVTLSDDRGACGTLQALQERSDTHAVRER